jgi:hypothetical protein
MTPEEAWQLAHMNAAHDFAAACAKLHESHPGDDLPALEIVMTTLATELWDRDFSQTEIRQAFEEALAALPAYAVYERRSTSPR